MSISTPFNITILSDEEILHPVGVRGVIISRVIRFLAGEYGPVYEFRVWTHSATGNLDHTEIVPAN